jgi:hypothetical protein
MSLRQALEVLGWAILHPVSGPLQPQYLLFSAVLVKIIQLNVQIQ